jgi:hypothetical protein
MNYLVTIFFFALVFLHIKIPRITTQGYKVKFEAFTTGSLTEERTLHMRYNDTSSYGNNTGSYSEFFSNPSSKKSTLFTIAIPKISVTAP